MEIIGCKHWHQICRHIGRTDGKEESKVLEHRLDLELWSNLNLVEVRSPKWSRWTLMKRQDQCWIGIHVIKYYQYKLSISLSNMKLSDWHPNYNTSRTMILVGYHNTEKNGQEQRLKNLLHSWCKLKLRTLDISYILEFLS